MFKCKNENQVCQPRNVSSMVNFHGQTFIVQSCTTTGGRRTVKTKHNYDSTGQINSRSFASQKWLHTQADKIFTAKLPLNTPSNVSCLMSKINATPCSPYLSQCKQSIILCMVIPGPKTQVGMGTLCPCRPCASQPVKQLCRHLGCQASYCH